MNIQEMTWHRLFSQSFYKNKKLPLGEMSFLRDFAGNVPGDLYPQLQKSDDCVESVENGGYHLLSGSSRRLIGQYFPYASYEVSFSAPAGQCGFVFQIPSSQVSILCDRDSITFRAEGCAETLSLPAANRRTLIVTCRRQNFDVYFAENGVTRHFHTFVAEGFCGCDAQAVFQKGFVSLSAAAPVDIFAASFYLDCGVGQADLRPVCYENGEVLHEGGKVYMTFSIRMEADGIQGIFSWVPGTAQLELVGALFFDCGDGVWRNYIASSLVYHRMEQKWYIWTSAFENQRRLARGSCEGDPRFGINLIDVTLMDAAGEGDDYSDFVGFPGDEDPDFYYSEQEKKWYLAVCRIVPDTNAYRYAFFTSDNFFDGFRYIGCGKDGAETGGSFVMADGQQFFVCGNDFSKRANYRIYSQDGMRDATFDFDDGGFRGWGSVIPVKVGSRTRYFWITFDRHKGSSYTWSYGNIYCFEGVI